MPPRFGVSSAPAGSASASAAKSATAIASDGRYEIATPLSPLMRALPPVRLQPDRHLIALLHLTAGDPMAWAQFAQLRADALAFRDRERAARMEDAAGRRVDRARNLADDRLKRA